MQNVLQIDMLRALFFLIVFVAASQKASAGDKGELLIVTEHYPPYEMAEPINGLRGFDFEVVNEVFRMMGYTPNIQFLPWKRAIQMARVGRAVGLLTCAYTDERAEFIIFSDPISRFTNGFFVRKGFDGIKPSSIQDVKGEKVASVSGYESLDALKDAGFEPMAASNSEAALSMLLAKRYDYLYIGGEKTKFDLKQQNMEDAAEFHPIITKDFHFCFSKGFPGVEDLVIKFNNALDLLRYSGRYARIHAKYR